MTFDRFKNTCIFLYRIITSAIMKNKLTLLMLLLAVMFLIDFESSDCRHILFRLFHNLLILKHTFLFDYQRPNLSIAYRAAENLIPNRSMHTVDITADVQTIVKQKRDGFRVEIVIPYPRGCQSKRHVLEYEGQTVETYWLDYRQKKQNTSDSNRILLYFHGGGYVLGDFQGVLDLLTSQLQ